MSKPTLQIALSQQLQQALRVLVAAPGRFQQLTPHQQAIALRQLAQVAGVAQQALWLVTRAPGSRKPG